MSLTAAMLLDRIYASVDDIHRIHTPEALGLQALTRAQEWVSLRFALLRRTYPVLLAPTVQLYDRLALAPQAVTTLSASLNGVPLGLTPLTALRYRDPQWLATAGTPLLLYCVRWRLWGVHPVPTTEATLLVTCLAVALPLTAPTQGLEIPDSYADHVEQVALGLLLLGRERHLQVGVTAIQQGLALTREQVQALVAGGAL